MFINSQSALEFLHEKANKTLVPANEAQVTLPLIHMAMQTIANDLERLRHYDLDAAAKRQRPE